MKIIGHKVVKSKIKRNLAKIFITIWASFFILSSIYSQTEWSQQITNTANDGRVSSGNLFNATNTFYLNDGSYSDWAYAYFTNVTIPQGATINSAQLEVVFYYATTLSMEIYLEDEDNPTVPSNNTFDSRNKTTATVSWTGSTSAQQWHYSPDISALVQEVVDRAGWSSGNAMDVIIDVNNGSNPGGIDVSAAGSAGYTTILRINYTEGGGPATNRRIIITN